MKIVQTRIVGFCYLFNSVRDISSNQVPNGNYQNVLKRYILEPKTKETPEERR